MDGRARNIEMAYRIDHRHPDGSWGEMVEDRSNNPADDDPERKRSAPRIFRCTSCEQTVTIADEEAISVPER